MWYLFQCYKSLVLYLEDKDREKDAGDMDPVSQRLTSLQKQYNIENKVSPEVINTVTLQSRSISMHNNCVIKIKMRTLTSSELTTETFRYQENL